MLAASELFRPKARTTGLVVEEMGDETLVYDCKTHGAHLLAGSTLKIWQLCDGKRRNTDIVDVLDGPDASLIVVDGALAELEAFDLLEQPEQVATRTTPSALSRRAFLTNAVGASVFVGATIVTLDVPLSQTVLSIACTIPGQPSEQCRQACPSFAIILQGQNVCECSEAAEFLCNANGLCEVDARNFVPESCGCIPTDGPCP